MKRMKTALFSLSILAICIALMMADKSSAQSGNQKSNESSKPQAVAQTQSEEGVVIGYPKRIETGVFQVSCISLGHTKGKAAA